MSKKYLLIILSLTLVFSCKDDDQAPTPEPSLPLIPAFYKSVERNAPSFTKIA